MVGHNHKRAEVDALMLCTAKANASTITWRSSELSTGFFGLSDLVTKKSTETSLSR